MGLNDLISTPFGQSMSAGRRLVGRRSSRLFRQSEKAGGESTAEGRRIRGLGGMHLLAEGEGTQRPEKSDLIDMGEDLKLAIASGELDPIKDIKPLQGNFFGHLQASNLSPEEKEGIRALFADPFDELAKKQEDAEDRRLQRKQLKVGVKKAQQDIKRGAQIQEAAAIEIENAEEQQREREAGRDKRADLKIFLNKLNKHKEKAIEFNDLNARQKARTDAGKEADVLDEIKIEELAAEGIRSDQAMLQDLNSWMANNPDILFDQRSTAQISSIGNLLGADKEWQRKVELSDRSYERGLKTTIIQQAMAAGLELPKGEELEDIDAMELAKKLIDQSFARNEKKAQAASDLEKAKVFRDVGQNLLRISGLITSDYPEKYTDLSPETGFKTTKNKLADAVSHLEAIKKLVSVLSKESPLLDEERDDNIDSKITAINQSLLSAAEKLNPEGTFNKKEAFAVLEDTQSTLLNVISRVLWEATATRKSEFGEGRESEFSEGQGG